ncbi:MAG: Cna B-type domain-containing protein, partial [Clostridia bacterium]|nr:Cna B-type domain-containing protein [Clostridia bacterium]
MKKTSGINRMLAFFIAFIMTVSLMPLGAFAETEETWTVTFYNRDAEVHKTVEVTKGEAIGENLPAVIPRDDRDAYWAIGEIVQGGQGNEIRKTGDRIDETFTPTDDTVIVPDYELILYTVTFYKDDTLAEVVTTKTVDAGSSYCLNDIPTVPAKQGHTAKWVYADGDFSNNVALNGVESAQDTRTLAVWAEYEQNVFTVKYIVEGETHTTDTYYSGDTLTLPADPVVEGKDFDGWFDGDTEYSGGEAVTSDLTLVAKFKDQYAVSFVVLADDGSVIERLAQYFKSSGEAIQTMPQDPFVAGKVFVKWVNEDTGEEVTADTVVTESFRAIAEFRPINVYIISVKYWYTGNNGEVVFNEELIEVEAHDLPYTITTPGTTQTDPDEVAGGPLYYPSTPTLEITQDDFDEQNEYSGDIEYVEYTAEYDFVYMLKDLTGSGYTEIPDSRVHIFGVLNSYVTPAVKTFDFAVLELAEGQQVTQAEGQELEVKYTRKNFQVSYESNGGSYVGGATVPYGTEYTPSSTVPTRAGYTFEGWYTDAELTQKVTGTVTINDNTTLYANWTGDTVNYTIVYMFEKYNDAGTQSSYVYDNSETGNGTVGSTVFANDNSVPDKTKKGWEKDTTRNAESSVVITADGSAVLYVYYKLTTYTFTFTIHNSSNNGRYRMTIGGTTYRASDNTKYSFTAKLGEDISAKWPMNGGNATIWDNNNGYYFYYWSCQGTSYASKILRVMDALLPNTGTSISVTGHWRNNNNNVQVNYYLQNADDNGYTLSTLYSQTAPSGNYNPKEISGYTYDHSDNTTSWGTITAYNFYYKRHTYQIEYYHGTDKLKTISNVKYDATITSSTYNWTPTQAECGVDSDFIWGGWYDNAGCEGTPYTFSKMPAGATNGSVALVLYAKWTAPSYTVSFVDGANTSSKLFDDVTVEKYGKTSNPGTPSKSGYVFDGWFAAATGTDLFDWNTQITSDTTVYAHWTQQTLGYTVEYVDNSDDHLPVAPEKTVTNPNFTVGQTVTEQAIAVAGYRPLETSASIELSGDASENVITLVYVEKGEYTSYTVKYVLDPEEFPGEEIIVAETKVMPKVPGSTASVVEIAKAVNSSMLPASLSGKEFFPDAAEKSFVLTAVEENNVFYFYYSAYRSATVTVHYVDMDGNALTDDDVNSYKVGKTFTLSRTPIAGYEIYKAVVGTSKTGSAAGTDYKITDAIAESGLEFTVFYQKKVTITAVSASKQYDGEVLALPEALADQIIVEGLLEGHSITSVEFTYSGADSTSPLGRLNAGTATVTPKNAQITADTPVSSDYYTIRYISGNLEVTRINVTIRIEPDRWTGAYYNGNPYKTGFTNPTKEAPNGAAYVIISHEGYAEEYQDEIWAKVIALDNVTYEKGAAGLGYYVLAEKDVGDYTYNLALTSEDVTFDDNYSVSLYVRPGRLQILPVSLTVTTESDEKQYDGTPLTNSGATLEGLVDADANKVTVTATGSQTEVGSSENAYEISWGDVNPDNYTITENLGTLEVKTRTLTVTVKDKTVDYNGSEQNGYTLPETITGTTGKTIETDDYTVAGLAEGDVLTVTYTPAKGTDADTYDNGEFAVSADTAETTVVYTISKSDGTDVTASYETPTFTPGKLIIEKAAITITINGTSDTQTYTGEELTSGTEVTASSDDDLFDESKFSYDGATTITEIDADTYTEDIDITKASYDDENVEVEFVAGDPVEFIIEKATVTVTITEHSGEFDYDGDEKTVSGYDVDIDNDLYTEDDFTFDGDDTVAQTDPGTYDMELTEDDFHNNNDNFDVTFAIVDGQLVIGNISTQSIIAKITWSDDNDRDGKRSGVVAVMQLYKTVGDGEPVPVGEEYIADHEDGIVHEWTNLPIFEDEQKIVYSVKETLTTPNEYTIKEFTKTRKMMAARKAAAITEMFAPAELGETVTFVTEHEPEIIDIAVEKVWDDADNKDELRPDSVSVTLTAGTDSYTATIDEASQWTYTFEGLYRYADGKEIEYDLTEDPVDGYETAITGNAADGFTVTNTHVPAEPPVVPETTDVSITKQWADNNDADGIRPDAINVTIYMVEKAPELVLRSAAVTGKAKEELILVKTVE